MPDPIFEIPEREPLFEDDPNDGQPIQYQATDFDVTRLAGARQKAEKMLARLKKQKADYTSWYNDRIAKIEQRIDDIDTAILDILHQMDEKTVATPLGTFTRKPSTRTVWPRDSEVVAWVEQSVPDAHKATLLRFNSAPDKEAIKKYLAENAVKLPGFSVTSTETLTIRKAAA
jgi:hypothetical protein